MTADAIRLESLSLPSCPSHKGKEEQVEDRKSSTGDDWLLLLVTPPVVDAIK